MPDPTDKQTCATCRHFDQMERADVVVFMADGERVAAMSIVGVCDHNEARAIVRNPPPSFGCVHHTPIDPKDA